MIKKLQRQIFRTIFITLGSAFFLLLLVANAAQYYVLNQQVANGLFKYTAAITGSTVNSADGKHDTHGIAGGHGGNQIVNQLGNQWGSREHFIQNTAFYTVTLNEEGTITDTRKQLEIDSYTEEQMQKFASAIFKNKTTSEKKNGLLGRKEKLKYYVVVSHDKTYITFCDFTDAWDRIIEMVLLSLVGFFVALVLFAWISKLLSRKISRPVEAGFEKQKQFISDASHELKTPLAVIRANSDLLNQEIGENKWLSYIQSEVGRMNTLIGNLLALTRLEKKTEKEWKQTFDFSSIVNETALPFESIAYESEIDYEMDIQPDISYEGNSEEIKQLIAILLDNAIKYTTKQGKVVVSVKKNTSTREKIILSVKNTGEPIAPQEQEKIFERFYRVDKARSGEDGHYGLGLAIAKSIVEKHNAKIYVKSGKGWNDFLVIL